MEMEKPNRDELAGIIAGARYAKELISSGRDRVKVESVNVPNTYLVREDWVRARDSFEGAKDIFQTYIDRLDKFIDEKIEKLLEIS